MDQTVVTPAIHKNVVLTWCVTLSNFNNATPELFPTNTESWSIP
jgi:hypothetical protein